MRQMKIPAGTHSKIFTVALSMMAALALVTAPVNAAPPPPNWLPGQPMLAGNQVIAMWLPVPGAVKYVVYLNGKKLIESPANQYIGPAPEGEGEFTYQVTAVDASGAEGPMSAVGKIVIKVIKPPTGITIRPDNKNKIVYIRWDVSPGAQIFNVFKADSADGPFKLISSQDTTSYKDVEVEFDKTYYYTVSAKDVSGKESKRSEPYEVTLEEVVEVRKIAAKPLNHEFHTLRMRKVGDIQAFGDDEYPVDLIHFAQRLRDGKIWVYPGYGYFLVLSGSIVNGQIGVEELIKIKKPEGVRRLEIGGIELSEDERVIYYTVDDLLVAVDRRNGETLWVSDPVDYPSQEQDPVMYEKRREVTFNKKPGLGPIVRLDGGRLLAAAGNVPWRFILSEDDGEVLGWQFGYTPPDDPEGQILGNPQFFMSPLEDGTVLVGEPLGHRIQVIDPETGVLVNTIGMTKEGYLGGFLGIRGFDFLPNGWLVVADPAMSQIQVFDPQSGSYITHLGDSTGKEDPSAPGRPTAEWLYPAFPLLFNDGKDMVVYHGTQKYFQHYRFIDDVQTFGQPIVDRVRADVQKWREENFDQ